MLYTRLASPVAMCIDIPRRCTLLAWLANPNPNLTKLATWLTQLAVCIDTLFTVWLLHAGVFYHLNKVFEKAAGAGFLIF